MANRPPQSCTRADAIGTRGTGIAGPSVAVGSRLGAPRALCWHVLRGATTREPTVSGRIPSTAPHPECHSGQAVPSRWPSRGHPGCLRASARTSNRRRVKSRPRRTSASPVRYGPGAWASPCRWFPSRSRRTSGSSSRQGPTAEWRCAVTVDVALRAICPETQLTHGRELQRVVARLQRERGGIAFGSQIPDPPQHTARLLDGAGRGNCERSLRRIEGEARDEHDERIAQLMAARDDDGDAEFRERFILHRTKREDVPARFCVGMGTFGGRDGPAAAARVRRTGVPSPKSHASSDAPLRAARTCTVRGAVWVTAISGTGVNTVTPLAVPPVSSTRNFTRSRDSSRLKSTPPTPGRRLMPTLRRRPRLPWSASISRGTFHSMRPVRLKS